MLRIGRTADALPAWGISFYLMFDDPFSCNLEGYMNNKFSQNKDKRRKAFIVNPLDSINKNNNPNDPYWKKKGLPNRVDNYLYRDNFKVKPKTPKDTKLDASFSEDFDAADKDMNDIFDSVENALSNFNKDSIPSSNKSRNSKPKKGSNSTKFNSTSTNNYNGSNSTNSTNFNNTFIDDYGDNKFMNNYTSSDSLSSNRSNGSRPNSRRSGNPNSGSGGYSYNNGGASNSSPRGAGGGNHWFGNQNYIKSKLTYRTRIPSGLTIDPNPKNLHGHSSLYIAQGTFFENYQYKWYLLDSDSNATIRDTSSVIDSYFNDVLSTDIFNSYLHQAESVRNRSVGQYFTREKFLKYTDSVINGLQLFYCLDSILAYDRESSQFNSGMQYLREQMTSDVILKLGSLARCLERQVIKPEIVNFIRFMFSTFKMSNAENAPLFKISYFDALSDFGSDIKSMLKDDIYIRKMIEQIDTDFNDAFAYIAAGYPEYKLVGKLPPSTTTPLVDIDFMTWWHNSDYTWPDFQGDYSFTDVNHSIVADSENEAIYYGLYRDDIDGILHAASSIYIGNSYQSGIYRPLLHPEEFRDNPKANACSLKFYRPSGTQFKFISAGSMREAGISAGIYKSWSWQEFPMTSTYNVPAGVQRVLSHNAYGLRQSVFEGTRYLLHP